MPRTKTKDGINKLYYLDKKEAELIKNLALANQMSQSEFIGFVVRNYYLQQNPLKQLEEVRNRREVLENSLKELKKEEDDSIKKINAFESTKKLRENKRKDAIEIIKRKIMEGADFLETQEIARFWAFRLNEDMNELMYIASKELKNIDLI